MGAELIARNPRYVDTDIVRDTAVNERFLHALVTVYQFGVLADHGDLDLMGRRDDALHHRAPGR